MAILQWLGRNWMLLLIVPFVLIMIVRGVLNVPLIKQWLESSPPAGDVTPADPTPWTDLWIFIWSDPIVTVVAIVVLGLMGVGTYRHLQSPGNGSKHAVTIIVAICFSVVLAWLAYGPLLAFLHGDEADVVRQAWREQIAGLTDIRKAEDGGQTIWSWLTSTKTLLVLAVALLAYAAFGKERE